MTRYEQIKQYVDKRWSPAVADKVIQDLLDVATGTREGNTYEKRALAAIFPDSVFNR